MILEKCIPETWYLRNHKTISTITHSSILKQYIKYINNIQLNISIFAFHETSERNQRGKGWRILWRISARRLFGSLKNPRRCFSAFSAIGGYLRPFDVPKQVWPLYLCFVRQKKPLRLLYLHGCIKIYIILNRNFNVWLLYNDLL